MTPGAEDDGLANALHDEIDEQELLSQDTRAVVEEARSHLIDLVDDLQDTSAAMEAVAVLVEASIGGEGGLARRAVRSGFEAARRRAAKVNGG